MWPKQKTPLFYFFPRRAYVAFDREFLWDVVVAGLQLSRRFPVAVKGDVKDFQAHLWQGEGPLGGFVGPMCAGVLVAGRRDGFFSWH